MLAFAPLDGAVGAAYVAVSALATAVEPLAGTAATAVAIILFTAGIRVLISPLSYAQVLGERRRSALDPRLRELRRRHGKDPARLRAETVALYRAEGVSPLAGCLPGLLQAPFFVVMYRLFTVPPDGAGLLDEKLLGVALGHRLADGLAGSAAPVFAALFALLAVLAWLSSRRLRHTYRAGTPAADGTLGRILPLLPYGTLAVAAIVPLAAGLSLVTTTAWTAVEHAVLRRPRPVAPP